jgi:hypothetical protein
MRSRRPRRLVAALALIACTLLARPLPVRSAPCVSVLPPAGHWIVGGQDAVAGAWPWLAALVEAGTLAMDTQYCGGTLVAPRWVLTAAHCVVDEDSYEVIALPADDIEVLMGLYRLSDESAAERLPVDEVILADYDPWTGDHDVALLYLGEPSTYPLVPALLTYDTEPLIAKVGTMGTAKGWGALDDVSYDYPDVLQEVDIPVADREVCNGPDAFDGGLTENMLCAGWAAGGMDTCLGDSGGPYMLPDGDGGEVLAGLVSWGYGCADPGVYGAYARVSRYGDWIRARMTERGDPADPCGPLGEPDACQAEGIPEVADEGLEEVTEAVAEEIAEEIAEEVAEEAEDVVEPVPEVDEVDATDTTLPDAVGTDVAGKDDSGSAADTAGVGAQAINRGGGGGCALGATAHARLGPTLMLLALMLIGLGGITPTGRKTNTPGSYGPPSARSPLPRSPWPR